MKVKPLIIYNSLIFFDPNYHFALEMSQKFC